MLRLFYLCLSILSVTAYGITADPQVSINMQVPDAVTAGEEFTVSLTIEKGLLRSFSRFSQDLPNGLTAQRLNTANADFSFEEQRVRFIWLKLPPETLIKVSYLIRVDQRLKGTFELGGEFSYIDNNQRKSISVPGGHEIMIKPKPGIAENQLIDIKDFGKNKAPLTVTKKEDKTASPSTTITHPQQMPENKTPSYIPKSTPKFSPPSSIQKLTATEKTRLLQPETGISFRVQIAMGSMPINFDKFFRDKGIQEKVKIEFIDGWRKYTIGPFQSYEEARKNMFRINNTSKINGAFVVAYRNGNRIDMFNALPKN